MSFQLWFGALQWQKKLLRGRQQQTNANNNGPFDIESPQLLEELRRNEPKSLVCLHRCIYRVPKRLRHVNTKAYTPNIVSIGPIHHGKEDLQAMEKNKENYLKDLIRVTGANMESYKEIVRQKEERLRACYDEPIKFESDKFVDIILMDAAFLIGVLMKFGHNNVEVEEEGRIFEKPQVEEEDRIFRNPWLLQDVWIDMLLMENQLPYFILNDLFDYRVTYRRKSGEPVRIFDLVHHFFKVQLRLDVGEDRLEEIDPSKIEHFVDFLRQLHLPSRKHNRMELETTAIPSITELHRAGVKLEVGSSRNLFDLDFENCKLTIPKLTLGDETEILFRNFIAFEQCHCQDTFINDYVIFMNHLVNTQKDLNLVATARIVENRCSNSEQGSSLINRLQDGAIFKHENYYFASLCEKLNKYYREPLHKWKADLIQKYFSTPWASTSLVVGTILLILTLIQTVCSIISIMDPKANG